MKKRLLITGASGLLGKALLERISLDDYEIIAVTKEEKQILFSEDILVVRCNLLDQTERRALVDKYQPEYIIHLAWDQAEGFRQADSNLLWLTASLDLLYSFKINKGKRFIFAGSSSEYDGENGVFSEGDSFATTQYGLCKRKFTEIGCKFGVDFGIEVVSARYFTLYGEYDRHLFGAIPSAINAFYRKERVYCKSPNTVRDYIYVGDAADATIELLQSDITGPINIASGRAQTIRDVFNKIAKQMKAEDLLYVSDKSNRIDILSADITRMKNELGYTCRTDFDEGIIKTINWWRDNIEL